MGMGEGKGGDREGGREEWRERGENENPFCCLSPWPLEQNDALLQTHTILYSGLVY